MDGMAIFSLLFGLNAISNKKRGLALGSGVLISFLSSSRWIMLNFIIISFQRAFTGKGIILKGLKYLVLLVGLVIITGLAASLLGVDIQGFIQNRLLASSASSRLYAFEVFFRLFPDQPLWGTGGAETSEMLRLTVGRGTGTIHVGWLLLFFYFGLAGGILYLLFLWSLLSELKTRARKSAYWGSYFVLIAYLVANITVPILDLSYYGVFLAIIFSRCIDNHPPEEPSEELDEPKTETKEAEAYQKIAGNW